MACIWQNFFGGASKRSVRASGGDEGKKWDTAQLLRTSPISLQGVWQGADIWDLSQSI